MAGEWEAVRELTRGAKLELGPVNSHSYLTDPRHLGFVLSRYKFAARMMRDCQSILDVGCGDGVGTLQFLHTDAYRIRGVDSDIELIAHANRNRVRLAEDNWHRISFQAGDFVRDPLPVENYHGVCSLDVIEHIEPDEAGLFLQGIAYSLPDHGVAIIGTPSAYAAQYASEASRRGHINLYTPDRLRLSLRQHFKNVWIFCMNDEVVHTGFEKMAHYILAVCIK